MAKDKQFTLFWRTGDRNVVDFHADGDCDHYAWDATKREWEPTTTHPDYEVFQRAAREIGA